MCTFILIWEFYHSQGPSHFWEWMDCCRQHSSLAKATKCMEKYTGRWQIVTKCNTQQQIFNVPFKTAACLYSRTAKCFGLNRPRLSTACLKKCGTNVTQMDSPNIYIYICIFTVWEPTNLQLWSFSN